MGANIQALSEDSAKSRMGRRKFTRMYYITSLKFFK